MSLGVPGITLDYEDNTLATYPQKKRCLCSCGFCFYRLWEKPGKNTLDVFFNAECLYTNRRTFLRPSTLDIAHLVWV